MINIIFKKSYPLYNIFLSDLADPFKFLIGTGDDTCRKIVKEEYFTFVAF